MDERIRLANSYEYYSSRILEAQNMRIKVAKMQQVREPQTRRPGSTDNDLSYETPSAAASVPNICRCSSRTCFAA